MGNRAFDQGGGTPLHPGSGGDLARQAGIDEVSRDAGKPAAAYDAGDAQGQGTFDVAQNDAEYTDDLDFDGDDDSDVDADFDSGTDSDTA
jgi:hypothetical protein